MGLALPPAYALTGLPRHAAHAAHSSAVKVELAWERARDAATPSPDDALVAESVTAVIKAFERRYALTRLVGSIRRLYPSLRIVVVDDSRRPTELPSVTTVGMPYDSGIAAGRNEGVRHAETPYVLMLDDDHVFTRKTLLAPALALMEAHPEIDIMGGQLTHLPLYRKQPNPSGIFNVEATPRVPIGSFVGGLEVVDKSEQFMLARRDALERVLWDPRLKRLDHGDFFTRALGVLVTVFNPELRALHVRTPFDRAYMSKRLDVADSQRILRELYVNR